MYKLKFSPSISRLDFSYSPITSEICESGFLLMNKNLLSSCVLFPWEMTISPGLVSTFMLNFENWRLNHCLLVLP